MPAPKYLLDLQCCLYIRLWQLHLQYSQYEQTPCILVPELTLLSRLPHSAMHVINQSYLDVGEANQTQINKAIRFSGNPSAHCLVCLETQSWLQFERRETKLEGIKYLSHTSCTGKGQKQLRKRHGQKLHPSGKLHQKVGPKSKLSYSPSTLQIEFTTKPVQSQIANLDLVFRPSKSIQSEICVNVIPPVSNDSQISFHVAQRSSFLYALHHPVSVPTKLQLK